MTDQSLQSFQNKLTEHKEQEENRLMEYLSEKYRIPVIHIANIQINPDALQLVKEADAREARMAIYKRLKGKVTVAVNDPNNPKLREMLEMLEGKGYTHELTLASAKTLGYIWEFYRDIIATSTTVPGTLSIANKDLEDAVRNIRSVETVRDVLHETKGLQKVRKTSKNIEYIVAAAIAIDASDIHIEPTRGGGLVRYRIDGVLTDVIDLPQKEYRQIITRMKLLSHMKITTKGAQDGGFVIHLSDRVISARASVIPDERDGSFVLRLLDPKNVIHSIEKLGLHPVMVDVFRRYIRKPSGMILTTGPTGSGKTTTLYSFLNAVKDGSSKIITLEDPIEYRLEGVVQTQIEKDYSFASGLRAILRQDPDIILVGEMRDSEVAEIGIQAALTGHLVFSTLHTNDALGALHRLAQLEIDPQVFSRAINIVIAQRLVRVLCPHCSENHPLTAEQKERIERMAEEFPESYRKEPFGTDSVRRPGPAAESCRHCTDGYKGRIGIFELFEVNDTLERVFRSGEGMDALHDAVQKQGYPFMKDDGLWKVLRGITSLAELERVIGIQME